METEILRVVDEEKRPSRGSREGKINFVVEQKVTQQGARRIKEEDQHTL